MASRRRHHRIRADAPRDASSAGCGSSCRPALTTGRRRWIAAFARHVSGRQHRSRSWLPSGWLVVGRRPARRDPSSHSPLATRSTTAAASPGSARAIDARMGDPERPPAAPRGRCQGGSAARSRRPAISPATASTSLTGLDVAQHLAGQFDSASPPGSAPRRPAQEQRGRAPPRARGSPGRRGDDVLASTAGHAPVVDHRKNRPAPQIHRYSLWDREMQSLTWISSGSGHVLVLIARRASASDRLRPVRAGARRSVPDPGVARGAGTDRVRRRPPQCWPRCGRPGVPRQACSTGASRRCRRLRASRWRCSAPRLPA